MRCKAAPAEIFGTRKETCQRIQQIHSAYEWFVPRSIPSLHHDTAAPVVCSKESHQRYTIDSHHSLICTMKSHQHPFCRTKDWLGQTCHICFHRRFVDAKKGNKAFTIQECSWHYTDAKRRIDNGNHWREENRRGKSSFFALRHTTRGYKEYSNRDAVIQEVKEMTSKRWRQKKAATKESIN